MTGSAGVSVCRLSGSFFMDASLKEQKKQRYTDKLVPLLLRQ